MKRLRAAGTDVERELESIRSEAAHQTSLGRQLEAVRYYLAALISDAETRCLGMLPDHVTNYVDLLQDIEAWRVRTGEREKVCLVTFNYDTLLDRACRTVLGLKFGTPDAFIDEGNYILLKLHGSLEWSEEVEPPGKPLVGSTIERENQLIDLTGRYERTRRYVMSRPRHKWMGPAQTSACCPHDH